MSFILKSTVMMVILPVFIACTKCSVHQNEDNASPNIVLILVDDMGFSDIGPYGGEINTPNLDYLSDHGVRFTQFYNAGRCCPTRASLLTGLYPHQAGIGYMEPLNKYNKPIRDIPEYQGFLNQQCITIAEVLQASGYQTFISGKWHVGSEQGQQPLDRGFDRFFGILGGASHHFTPGPDKIFLDREPQNNLPSDFYTTDYFTRYARKFVSEAGQNAPFFLYLAFTAPHWPLHAWPEDIEKYKGRYLGGWDSIRDIRLAKQIELGIFHERTANSLRHEDSYPWEIESDKEDMDLRMAVYAAMIESIDRGIGKLIQTLKETGKFDNTLILFISDNGGCAEPIGRGKPDEPAGDPDSYQGYWLPWANASNTPFRLFKHWVHEGGIATPLIAYWLGHFPEGQINFKQLGHVKDIMPTLLAAADVNYPVEYKDQQIKPTEGINLLRSMENPEFSEPQTLFWEHEGNRAIRKGIWKLVSYYNDEFDTLGTVGTGKRTGKWELYNMQHNRTETNDLMDTNFEIADSLLQEYNLWAQKLRIRDWQELLHFGGFDR